MPGGRVDAIGAFRAALPPGLAIDDPAAIAPRLTDWRGRTGGPADLLLAPATTPEVASIVRAARAHGVALVPQGGLTGLVGGALVPHDLGRPTALVSLHRMAAIGPADPHSLSIACEAGAILQHVHEAAAAAGCRFPLSLGAKGSATIGGLAATNAGGTQVLRHGTMRALVLGLEAVFPDGSILNQLPPLRKDNSGYDLKQLLIGSEGTLGIVTRVSLRLAPALSDRAVAWAGLHDPAAALALLGRLRHRLGERVESFELIDRAAHDLVLAHLPGARPPLGGDHAFHCLIEAECPEGLLSALLSDAMAAALVQDATVAASLAQADALWRLREAIPEAERQEGGAVKNDVAVAVADVPAFDARARALVAAAAPGARPLVFGHLGDGNLHWNIRPPLGCDPRAWLEGQGEGLRARLHDLVMAFGGAISAEHGIGLVKAAELARLADPARLAAMRAVKAALDPDDIMNPGKILAPSPAANATAARRPAALARPAAAG